MRTDRSWLRWAIPAVIVLLLLPFVFHRGHRPEQNPAAVEQQTPGQPGQPMEGQPGQPGQTGQATEPPTGQAGQTPEAQQQQHLAMASTTSVYVASDATLSDADRQKLADVANSARQSGGAVSVSGEKTQADAVRQALVSQGVPESQIEVKEPASAPSNGRVDVTSK
jgi:outer membrane protein OmpA-like peptidoglycan-associated protein